MGRLTLCVLLLALFVAVVSAGLVPVGLIEAKLAAAGLIPDVLDPNNASLPGRRPLTAVNVTFASGAIVPL